VQFLEFSGVGRIMADATDQDEARAERMDGWIIWETEKRVMYVCRRRRTRTI
jgi:hypothetical protein